MTEVAPSELRNAVESQHGGMATYNQSVSVHEKRGGMTIWNGTVAVFDLMDSPSGATTAYAWSKERGDGRRRFFAVLHADRIKSPVDAVRAAIVADARAKP